MPRRSPRGSNTEDGGVQAGDELELLPTMVTAIAWRGLPWRRQEKEEGEMGRPGNPRVGGMIYRVKGAAPAVKSTQASTWTCWMSCGTGARRRTRGIGIGGLAGLKEVSEVGWLEGKGPGGFG